jgi:hypothetical protein
MTGTAGQHRRRPIVEGSGKKHHAQDPPQDPQHQQDEEDVEDQRGKAAQLADARTEIHQRLDDQARQAGDQDRDEPSDTGVPTGEQ